MDSGNSSSMQSSSGGDDDYDSRADQSLSAFLDHQHHHAGGLQPPPQNQHHQQQLLHFNNPLISNYFDNNLLTSSSSSFTFLPENPSAPDPTSRPDLRSFAAASSLPRPPPPPPQNNTNSNTNTNTGIVKKSKKRSRASRRAPTTVLKTDTSNFRAMVQEFTGIPAPPLFSNNINTRQNIFLGLSPSSSAASYDLLRPFAQKLLPTSPLLSSLSSSSLDAVLRSSINNQLYNSSLPSSSSDVFQNLNLQSLLQDPAANTNPNSHNHEIMKPNVFTEDFNLGDGLQNSNRDGDHGSYGDSVNHANHLRLIAENGEDNSSGFHNDKGVENPTASRNEGMVESWLCSSSDQRT